MKRLTLLVAEGQICAMRRDAEGHDADEFGWESWLSYDGKSVKGRR